MANGMMSIIVASRSAPSMASSSEATISFWAATTSTRTSGSPSGDSIRSSCWKSRMASVRGMGISSSAWNSMAERRSDGSISGSSAGRTTTRWLPTPRMTFFVENPASPPEALQGEGHGPGLGHLAGHDGPGGQRHLAEPHQRHGAVAAEHDLGRPHPVGADVEADDAGGHQATSRSGDATGQRARAAS